MVPWELAWISQGILTFKNNGSLILLQREPKLCTIVTVLVMLLSVGCGSSCNTSSFVLISLRIFFDKCIIIVSSLYKTLTQVVFNKGVCKNEEETETDLFTLMRPPRLNFFNRRYWGRHAFLHKNSLYKKLYSTWLGVIIWN